MTAEGKPKPDWMLYYDQADKKSPANAVANSVGGLVPGLVIAVPTSTGYGAARGGETALFSSLVSCAPGVVVVNIDNGYGAACAALRSLRGVVAGH